MRKINLAIDKQLSVKLFDINGKIRVFQVIVFKIQEVVIMF